MFSGPPEKTYIEGRDDIPRTIEHRTQTLLARERGGSGEWQRLHAILCMHHGWANSDSIDLCKVIDAGPIAQRMDEITRIEREAAEKRLAAQ